jgi:hypothetical protein
MLPLGSTLYLTLKGISLRDVEIAIYYGTGISEKTFTIPGLLHSIASATNSL